MFTAKYIKRDGSIFWEKSIISCIMTADRNLSEAWGRCLISVNGKSGRRASETNERLAMQSQKLAIAGELAAGIAHEVRNPLTSVSGFLQLMKAQYPERTDYFDIIFRRLKGLTLCWGAASARQAADRDVYRSSSQPYFTAGGDAS